MSIQVKGNLLDLRPFIIFDYGYVNPVTGQWSEGGTITDNIYLGLKSDGRRQIFTENPVDVTNYKTMEVIVAGNDDWPWDGPGFGPFTEKDREAMVVGGSPPDDQTPQLRIYDISELTGPLYPGMTVYRSTSSDDDYYTWVRIYYWALRKTQSA